jgi:hypothetical protein
LTVRDSANPAQQRTCWLQKPAPAPAAEWQFVARRVAAPTGQKLTWKGLDFRCTQSVTVCVL